MLLKELRINLELPWKSYLYDISHSNSSSHKMSKTKNACKFLMKCANYHFEVNRYDLLTFNEGKCERYVV